VRKIILRKIIGKISIPRVMTIQHPAISRLIAQDESAGRSS
jgi:hypothetical protein